MNVSASQGLVDAIDRVRRPALVVGLVALVVFASRDAFAGPGIAHQHVDELGPLGFRRRPA